MEFTDGSAKLVVADDGSYVFQKGNAVASCVRAAEYVSRQVELSAVERDIPGIGKRTGASVCHTGSERMEEIVLVNESAIATRVYDPHLRRKIDVATVHIAFLQSGGLLPTSKLRSCLKGCTCCTSDLSNDFGVLVNGWQSWSYCGSVASGQRAPKPATPSFVQRSFHDGAVVQKRKNSKSSYASEMFLVAGSANEGAVLAGFLTQFAHFGAVKFRPQHKILSVRARPDGWSSNRWTDWAVIILHEKMPIDPFHYYASWTANANNARLSLPVPSGWCSWYHYYAKVSHENVCENVGKLKELRREIPLRVVQVDDGWQKAWGDWEPNEKFPQGMKAVADDITAAGFVPGLWLAPFAADKNSELVRQHPEWCLRTKTGLLANSGNCGKWFCGLDLSRDDVVAYAASAVKQAAEWGFKYLKLDFLYAGVLFDGMRADQSETRASALRKALLAVRAAVGPDVFLVGCGCPIGSGIGVFDAMRIGCDVGPKWLPDIPWDKWNMPSVRTALRNSITRSFMHKRWWINDPDCVLLRSTTALTDNELRTIATVVALAGGMFMLSDELGLVPQHRLRIAKVITPAIPDEYSLRVPHVLTEEHPGVLHVTLNTAVGEVQLVAVINWSNKAVKKTVARSDLGLGHSDPMHCLEFWSAKYVRLEGDLETIVPPHGTKLFALRTVQDEHRLPQYLGSSIHFSCGLEVKSQSASESELKLELNINQDTEGHIVVYAPFQPRVSGTAAVSKAPIRAGENVWLVEVKVVAEGAELNIARE